MFKKSKKCIIVAEIGPNHNGNFKEACSLVKLAKISNCDAVKFQYRIADEEIFDKSSKSYYFNESRYNFIKKIQEFTFSEHKKLRKLVKDLGLYYICSVFSNKALAYLIKLSPDAIKIPSGEIDNIFLLEKIAKTNFPVVMSSGMSYIDEITKAIKIVKKKSRLVLLHCTSEYPTNLEDMNLKFINFLKSKYNCFVGISDHSRNIFEIASTVALGVKMIEVHFTKNRKFKGPDHKISLTLIELKKLVKLVRNLEIALGESKKKLGKHASEMRNIFCNSIVVKKKINKGEIITKNNLCLKKPGTGLNSKFLNKIIGRKAKRTLFKNYSILWSDIDK